MMPGASDAPSHYFHEYLATQGCGILACLRKTQMASGSWWRQTAYTRMGIGCRYHLTIEEIVYFFPIKGVQILFRQGKSAASD